MYVDFTTSLIIIFMYASKKLYEILCFYYKIHNTLYECTHYSTYVCMYVILYGINKILHTQKKNKKN